MPVHPLDVKAKDGLPHPFSSSHTPAASLPDPTPYLTKIFVKFPLAMKRKPPNLAPPLTHSSSGLGHRPFTAATRVRIPYGSPACLASPQDIRTQFERCEASQIAQSATPQERRPKAAVHPVWVANFPENGTCSSWPKNVASLCWRKATRMK